MTTSTLATAATIVTAPSLLRSLTICAKARRPAFVWGSPGIGKSDVVRQLAKDLGAFLIDVRASQWDAVDTRGVPYVTEMHPEWIGSQKITRWAIPSVFPTAADAAQHPLVVIFLDELNSAPASVQAALYQLILDRRLGDYVLPPNVVIFAAGNLETDRAVTHRMSTALRGRFVHFQLAVDNRAWERWALGADVHTAVIAYMRWKPEQLHQWDARSTSNAQPTPRTWQFVSDLVKTIEGEGGVDVDTELALMTGTIGEAAGTEFSGFLRIYRSLPDPDSIILTPDRAALHDDVAVNYALCGTLAKRSTPANFANVLKYAERMAQAANIGPEFMTLLVRTAALLNPSVTSTRAFIGWASDHQDALL